MVIERLLGDVPPSKFMEEHYLKLPFSLPEAGGDFVDLASWDAIESIYGSPGADVLIVKEGSRWEGDALPEFAEARRLHDDGHTMLVRHAEKHDPRLKQLADDFASDFSAAVDVHIYCTPAEAFGFGWHYDAEDVFILQTAGSKEYSLRKNTVNPWPLVETLPQDMKYGREIMPMMNCLLKAGDWLYIPNGYWHRAAAKEASISIAVGVMSTAAIDAFDFARGMLLSSLRWRQRLPSPGAAAVTDNAELIEQYRAIFAELGDDLANVFQDENFIRGFIDSRRR